MGELRASEGEGEGESERSQSTLLLPKLWALKEAEGIFPPRINSLLALWISGGAESWLTVGDVYSETWTIKKKPEHFVDVESF